MKEKDMSFEMKKRIEKEILSQINYLDSPLKECVLHAAASQGKMIRSRLLINTALLYGYEGDLETLISIGAAVEQGHLASLIHDDIIDNDDTRRGKPTVHSKFGLEAGIVAGDSLLFMMFLQVVNNVSGEYGRRIVHELAEMGLLLCEGEIEQCKNNDSSSKNLDNYIKICNRKTASYFVVMSSIGARIAGASDEEIEVIKKFAQMYGIYYQIRDDLLSLISSDKIEGKPLDSDKRNELVTAEYFLSDGIDLRMAALSYVYSKTNIPYYLTDNTFMIDQETPSVAFLAKQMLGVFEQDLQDMITSLKVPNNYRDEAIRQLISEVFR